MPSYYGFKYSMRDVPRSLGGEKEETTMPHRYLDEIIGHLGAALRQQAPCDDKIIMEHVSNAYTTAKKALIVVLTHAPTSAGTAYPQGKISHKMSQALSGCAVRAAIQQEQSRPLSDSDRHYLGAIKHRLKILYELIEDSPNIREQISDEVDWVNDKLRIHDEG